MHLPILYQDEHYVAVDKLSGLMVHRSPLDKLETVFALQLLRDQLGREVYPCHRLDRPTSGVLLFALNEEANRAAQSLFSKGKTRKTYEAVVRGWTQPEGHIDYPLRSEENPDKIQDAVTKYRTISQSTVEVPVGRYPQARISHIELTPETGRKHQLRRHLPHLRHPILGDTRHGDGAQNRFLREFCNGQHLMLRARALALAHPMTGAHLEIKAPVDPEFARILNRLGLW